MKSTIVFRSMDDAHFRTSRFLPWEEELGVLVGINHVVSLSNLPLWDSFLEGMEHIWNYIGPFVQINLSWAPSFTGVGFQFHVAAWLDP